VSVSGYVAFCWLKLVVNKTELVYAVTVGVGFTFVCSDDCHVIVSCCEETGAPYC